MRQPCQWIINLILISLLSSSSLISQENVFHIASKKQLFIDDQLVAQSAGVKWQVNPPRKAGPVITPVREKEGPRIATKSILQVGDEYWMYYTLYAPVAWLEKDWKGEVPNYIRKMTCLAKSQDGLHWERINAGLFDIGRGKDNAIVMPVTHGTIFIDPHKTRGSRLWFFCYIT